MRCEKLGTWRFLTKSEVQTTLPKREEASHKGTFGMGLIVAGSDEMPGSATLSAIGSIRTGLGRLVIATTKEVASVVATHVPEATFMHDGLRRVGEGEIPEKIASASIGPGLVDRVLIEKALEQLMQLPVPLVVDAGALEKRPNWRGKGPVILTPHPGEFSRITGLSIQAIENNRRQLAQAFAEKQQVTVVLKGDQTVIAFPNGQTYVNPTGNSALAKGGSGDVLTGIMTSFLATHSNYEDAVKNAVFVHGLCAERWCEDKSEASMTASDFAHLLPVVLKQLTIANN